MDTEKDFEELTGNGVDIDDDSLTEVVDDEVIADDEILPVTGDDGALSDSDEEKEAGDTEDEEYMSYMFGDDVLNER